MAFHWIFNLEIGFDDNTNLGFSVLKEDVQFWYLIYMYQVLAN